MALNTAVAAGAAFAITAAVTPLAARVARRLDIVDEPGPLKVQSRAVPYLGGIAVLAGLIGPVLAVRPAVAIPLVLATALGLVDDTADLSPAVRVPAEVAIGLIVPAVVGVPWPAAPVVTAAVLVLVNALNLLDGLDGLASGVALASAIGFALVLAGDFSVVAVALAGALAGFLLWNRPPARIYLGDAGSYLIGTTLAVLLAATLRDDGSASQAAAAGLLVGVPLGDMSIAIVRRWRAKRPLFAGDRGHVYDQLADRWWTPRQATAACIAAQVVLTVIAVIASNLSGAGAIAVAAVTAGVVAAWALRTFTSPTSWTA